MHKKERTGQLRIWELAGGVSKKFLGPARVVSTAQRGFFRSTPVLLIMILILNNGCASCKIGTSTPVLVQTYY